MVALDFEMRMGELFGLHWPQVDFAAGVVVVIQSLEESKGEFRLKNRNRKPADVGSHSRLLRSYR